MPEFTNRSEYSLTSTTMLMCHPATANVAVREIAVRIGWGHNGALALTYTLTGNCSRLRLPPSRPQTRVDGLWRHTCFEVFISRMDDPAYWEFNFSPSSEWAVYQFRGYRDRVSVEEIAVTPKIVTHRAEERFELGVCMHLPHLLTVQPLRLGLSAVIEDGSGKLSYWALKHPSEKPDFHHPDGFVLKVSPPNGETTGKENR